MAVKLLKSFLIIIVKKKRVGLCSSFIGMFCNQIFDAKTIKNAMEYTRGSNKKGEVLYSNKCEYSITQE